MLSFNGNNEAGDVTEFTSQQLTGVLELCAEGFVNKFIR